MPELFVVSQYISSFTIGKFIRYTVHQLNWYESLSPEQNEFPQVHSEDLFGLEAL